MIYSRLCLVVLPIHVSFGFARPASSASATPSVSRTVTAPTPAEVLTSLVPLDASKLGVLAEPIPISARSLSTLSSTTAPASSSTPLASSNVTLNTKTECLSGAKNLRQIKFTSAFNVTLPPLYAITTQWTIHYPAHLEKALKDAGFRIIKPGDSYYDRTVGCPWVGHGTYSRLSVKRGKLDVIGTNAYPIGVPDDITRIVKILRSTYPFTEITLILTFLMGIPISFIGLCFCIGYDDSSKVKRAARLQAAREKLSQEEREKKKMANLIKLDGSEKLQYHPPTIGDSRLLQLPPELHLEIKSHLHYQEMKTVRLTCRYLHNLIPSNELSREGWKAYLISREVARKPHQEIACFQCLELKLITEFPLFEQNKHRRENTYTSYRGRLLPASSINLARKCVDCTVECALSTDGIVPFQRNRDEYIFVCGSCGAHPTSQIMPVHHNMKLNGCWCGPCFEKNTKIYEHSWLRPLQTIFALISFSISMTGSAPNYLAPWACHTTLCILTMGSTANSYIMRSGEDARAGFMHFALKRQVLGTVCWAAIAAVWTWVLVMMDWTLPGRGPICAVTIFSYLELIMFIWGLVRDWRFAKAYREFERRQKRLPILTTT